MENETFAETLKRKSEEYPYFKHSEWLNEVKIIDPFIETIEIYGNFLNGIPLSDREKFIEDELLVWVQEYYCDNHMNMRRNSFRKSYYPRIDSSKKIKQITKTLKDFQNLIEEQFGQLIEDLSDQSADIHSLFSDDGIAKIKQISDSYNTSKLLHKDIKDKKFEWFHKDRFYNNELTSKKDLENMIKKVKQKYALNITDLSIAQLRDNLQTVDENYYNNSSRTISGIKDYFNELNDDYIEGKS